MSYDSSYDEWCEQDDVVPLTSPAIAESSQTLLHPFSLYAELGIKRLLPVAERSHHPFELT